jgi:Domain of unknown function (DUF4150)
MGGNVFANGLEISGKAVQAQTIAAMPDVCFTPPENPATPPGVPIPYPSFGMASDTESGTATVLISGEIVNIKNKSDEKKTSGTEAGCAAKKGVITSKNTGKKYFNAWSTDVKFEGEPVIRFSDIATHNHASPVGNAPPWPEIAKLEFKGESCTSILAKIGLTVHPYRDRKKHCKKGKQQSDHLLQNACVNQKRKGPAAPGFGGYDLEDAPCICLNDGTNTRTQHGKKTERQNNWATDLRSKGSKKVSYKQARDKNLEFTQAGHDGLKNNKAAMECLKMIVDTYFKSVTGAKNQAELDGKDCRVPGPRKKRGSRIGKGKK